jgi:hypothetical protein
MLTAQFLRAFRGLCGETISAFANNTREGD